TAGGRRSLGMFLSILSVVQLHGLATRFSSRSGKSQAYACKRGAVAPGYRNVRGSYGGDLLAWRAPIKSPRFFYLIVYTTFDPDRPTVLRLWVRTWAARGWTPRLLLSGEKSPAGHPHVACDCINFDFHWTTRPYAHLRARRAGAKGWGTAPIVRFPFAATDEDIFAWGRALNI